MKRNPDIMYWRLCAAIERTISDGVIEDAVNEILKELKEPTEKMLLHATTGYSNLDRYKRMIDSISEDK